MSQGTKEPEGEQARGQISQGLGEKEQGGESSRGQKSHRVNKPGGEPAKRRKKP